MDAIQNLMELSCELNTEQQHELFKTVQALVDAYKRGEGVAVNVLLQGGKLDEKAHILDDRIVYCQDGSILTIEYRCPYCGE